MHVTSNMYLKSLSSIRREQRNEMEQHLELYKNEYPLKNYKE